MTSETLRLLPRKKRLRTTENLSSEKRPQVSIRLRHLLYSNVTLTAVSGRSNVRADVKAILGLAIDRGAPGDVLGKVAGGGIGNNDERLNHGVGRNDGDGGGGLGGGVDDSIDGRVNGSLNVSVVLSTLDTIGLGKLVDVGSGLGGGALQSVGISGGLLDE